jgi:hypothetical protein
MSEFRSSTKTGNSFVAGTTFALKPVTYADVNGRAIFEGDIDLGSVEQMEQVRHQVENPTGEPTPFGVGITGTQFRWPNATIPFRLAAGLPNPQRVTDAISHIQSRTNLRFVNPYNRSKLRHLCGWRCRAVQLPSRHARRRATGHLGLRMRYRQRHS